MGIEGKVMLTWADDGRIGKFESLMQIPELKKREPNKAEDEHPSLPFPELIVPVDADEQELYARLCEDKTHP